MKRRNVWKKEEAVSPVIATILMVAITVVLAATLYMMLPGADEGDAVTAMSGSRSRSGDNWIISINAGNVPFNGGEDFRLYDPATGASISVRTGDGETAGELEDVTNEEQENVGFYYGGKVHEVWFNDNTNDERIRGGDTIVIKSPTRGDLEGLQFRIAGTALQVTL